MQQREDIWIHCRLLQFDFSKKRYRSMSFWGSWFLPSTHWYLEKHSFCGVWNHSVVATCVAFRVQRGSNSHRQFGIMQHKWYDCNQLNNENVSVVKAARTTHEVKISTTRSKVSLKMYFSDNNWTSQAEFWGSKSTFPRRTWAVKRVV